MTKFIILRLEERPKYISSAPNLAKIRACADLVMHEEFYIISM